MAGTQKSKITPPPAIPDEDDAPALPATAKVVDAEPEPEPDDATDNLVVAEMGDTVAYRGRPGALIKGKRVMGNWTGRVSGKLVSVDDGCPVDGLPGNVVKALGNLIEA